MKTLEELKAIAEKVQQKNKQTIKVSVGMASCGQAAGAKPVLEALKKAVADKKLENVSVELTGCLGFCRLEPMVEVFFPGEKRITYVNITPDKVPAIVEEHLIKHNIVKEYTIGPALGLNDVYSMSDTPFFKQQMRIALRNSGNINPEDINEYIATGGYQALAKALAELTPQQTIDVVAKSGIRGRGGAGFPAGRKWQAAADSASPDGVKNIVCNADEGDPGAFMDRSVLEGDPHSVIEAMALAGYGVGASKGYIYVRAEYPIAVYRLQIAIEQAREAGLLGENIMDSGFSYDIEIRQGAGAFVCGESTALQTSIAGNRGEPRPRPPASAQRGLFNRPTVINNVETLANLPWIFMNGAETYAAIGTPKSTGTKVFALGGKITNTGLVEVPMGTPLRTLIDDIGGGCPNGKKFKAAQTGGPSGGCIPAALIDTPIDFEHLAAIGSMMGSGGLIVIDEDNCMVDIAKFFLDFVVDESCGKCTPCRIGTKRLYQIMEKITDGTATLEDLDTIEELCEHLQRSSLCALGQTAPNPVLSTMRNFHDEYIAHVVDKRCPAGVCKNLVQYKIDPEKCVGCTLCARNCPVGAISGKVKEPHVIDQSKCIKCGVCMANCKFGAISKG